MNTKHLLVALIASFSISTMFASKVTVYNKTTSAIQPTLTFGGANNRPTGLIAAGASKEFQIPLRRLKVVQWIENGKLYEITFGEKELKDMGEDFIYIYTDGHLVVNPQKATKSKAM